MNSNDENSQKSSTCGKDMTSASLLGFFPLSALDFVKTLS